MTQPYEIHYIKWNNIEIEIRHCPNWSKAVLENYGYPLEHLEVETINPKRNPLPITETGYRSHFTSNGEINEAGGAVKFVRSALDVAAQTESWKLLDAQSRQGTLF